jgi:hypothetical protein
MRKKKHEQILIRVIKLLENAELGERRETILNLLHSAHRASRERNDFTAQEYSADALRELRKARHSLRVAGAAEGDIILTESATAMLLPVYEDARADMRAMLFTHSLVWRCIALLVIMPIAALCLSLGLRAIWLLLRAW